MKVCRDKLMPAPHLLPGPHVLLLLDTSRPWLAWLLGLLFSVAGLYLLIELWNSPLMGLIFLAAGLGVLLIFGRVTSLTLDRLAGTATLRQFGLPRTTRTVPLADVCGAVVESHRSSRGGSTYRVVLALRSGASLPLGGIYESGWRAKNAQAQRINHFLGVDPPRPEGPFGSVPRARREGVTDGIAWQLEVPVSGQSTPVTRWHAGGAGLPGGFLLLLLTQRKVGGLGPGGGLVAAFARQAYGGVLYAFGFDPSEIPGLSQAVSVEPQDPALAEHLVTLTTQPEAARRWLNAEVCRILAAWAEDHPGRGGEIGSLCIVTAPFGLWICVPGPDDDPARIEDMTRLGVALVRAQPAAETAA